MWVVEGTELFRANWSIFFSPAVAGDSGLTLLSPSLSRTWLPRDGERLGRKTFSPQCAKNGENNPVREEQCWFRSLIFLLLGVN